MAQKKSSSTPFWKMEIGKKKPSSIEVEHPEFERALPQVNLIPGSVRESISVRKIRRAYVFGFLAILVLVTLVWLMQNGSILEQEARLTSSQNESVTISNQVTALAPVEQLYQQITTQEAFITDAVASEALTSSLLAQLRTVAGADVNYSSISVSFTGIPKPELSAHPETALNECPNADPFGKDITIGCLTFSAQAPTRADVSRFLVRAEKNAFLVGPYVTASTITQDANGNNRLNFSGSAGISLEALRTSLTSDETAALREAALAKSGEAVVDPTAK
ncbi:MAG: PilN domain-containing protein [Candidatus Nanopelagicales bacterium]